MFTGLVEETAEVLSFTRTATGARLVVKAAMIVATGDSVAVNGCCLTAVDLAPGQLSFDLLDETLRVTNLGDQSPGSTVNLERALAADGRLGGHFVQGHIDNTAEVCAFAQVGKDWRLEVALAPPFARWVVGKGSICLNGVSLTVAELGPESLVVWLIPHTLEATNLHRLQPGARLNVEYDLLAKYVERMVAPRLAPDA